jgi:hypothetical protein
VTGVWGEFAVSERNRQGEVRKLGSAGIQVSEFVGVGVQPDAGVWAPRPAQVVERQVCCGERVEWPALRLGEVQSVPKFQVKGGAAIDRQGVHDPTNGVQFPGVGGQKKDVIGVVHLKEGEGERQILPPFLDEVPFVSAPGAIEGIRKWGRWVGGEQPFRQANRDRRNERFDRSSDTTGWRNGRRRIALRMDAKRAEGESGHRRAVHLVVESADREERDAGGQDVRVAGGVAENVGREIVSNRRFRHRERRFQVVPAAVLQLVLDDDEFGRHSA